MVKFYKYFPQLCFYCSHYFMPCFIVCFKGLMISAYAKAASALNIEEYRQKATRAAEFLETYAWNSNTNSLLRSCYVNENGDIANM